jgi:outer membrane protein
MKRSLAIIALLASGLLLSAAAQSPAAPAGPAKIVVIDFHEAVEQTNEGQRNLADLQKKYAPKDAELKASGEEIVKLADELKAQGDKLSMADRASRAATIDKRKRVLERSITDLRSDVNQEVQEMLSALASKVYDVLAGYARQQGYTLVLDIAQQQSPVTYAQPSINITKAIIDEYNLKSGVPAPVGPRLRLP